ncbi:3-hydroxyacyl-CoA dehydrogenase NAD-binding domain-containing protein [Streptomyces sp. M19]
MADDMRTVGVVGAGVMGTGLAQVLAQTGHEVILVDRTEEILGRAARRRPGPALRQAAGRRCRDAVEPRGKVLERISYTTGYEGFERADFVVENVTEDWETKRGVYERIDPLCPEHCVFAANTSVIPITRIGAATSRRDRVLGMHFMNPVPLKPTVEMVRGHHTSQATVDTARRLLERMGKDAVLVEDSPGSSPTGC